MCELKSLQAAAAYTNQPPCTQFVFPKQFNPFKLPLMQTHACALRPTEGFITHFEHRFTVYSFSPDIKTNECRYDVIAFRIYEYCLFRKTFDVSCIVSRMGLCQWVPFLFPSLVEALNALIQLWFAFILTSSQTPQAIWSRFTQCFRNKTTQGEGTLNL